jgi:DNA-binding transcriptional MerR regulator
MSNEEKLFYSIGEVAEIVQVKPYVLRYWESEFKKLNPQKSFTGQRTYRAKDIQVALTIKKLLYDDKYTIAGAIQKLVELESQGQLAAFNGTHTIEASVEAKVVEAISPIPEPARPKVDVSNAPEITQPAMDMKKVKDLKTLLEATKKVLKKYNLS